MPTLRTLHISDLHIAGAFSRSLYGTINIRGDIIPVCNIDALKALTELIYHWQDRLDAIFISGDIAATGANYDLRKALSHFSSPAMDERPWLNSENEPTFKAFKKPIILLPGNHDRYRNISGWPSKLFDNYFSRYWKAGAKQVTISYLPSEDNPIMAIICCDFSLKNIFDSNVFIGGHWGQGKVYNERVEAMITLTGEVREFYPHCPVIWMVHFAPEFEGLANNLKLIDSLKLVAAANDVGVKDILCGHTHVKSFYRLNDDQLGIHCAGSATCIKNQEDTTIHLRYFEIENGKIIQVKSRLFNYDRSVHQFN